MEKGKAQHMSYHLKEYAEYILVKSMLNLSKIVPKKILLAIVQYFVLRHFQKRNQFKKKRILDSLTRAFPTKSNSKIAQLAQMNIEHYALLAYEIIMMITNRFDYKNSILNADEVRTRLSKLQSRADRGLIFITGHFSNWEVAGQFLADCDIKMTLITNKLNNKYITDRILVPFRTKNIHKSISRSGSMIAIMRDIKNGGIAGLLIDQMIPPPNGIEIDFFGQKAYATKSIAQMKLRLDPLIVPCFVVRVGIDKFMIEIGDCIEYVAAEVSDQDTKISRITQYYSKLLEQRIRKTPEQWQWNYKRWRMP